VSQPLTPDTFTPPVRWGANFIGHGKMLLGAVDISGPAHTMAIDVNGETFQAPFTSGAAVL
jgi:hypothetical protein